MIYVIVNLKVQLSITKVTRVQHEVPQKPLFEIAKVFFPTCQLRVVRFYKSLLLLLVLPPCQLLIVGGIAGPEPAKARSQWAPTDPKDRLPEYTGMSDRMPEYMSDR